MILQGKSGTRLDFVLGNPGFVLTSFYLPLLRKNLAFSKNPENHIGAIWYFIHDYNAQLAKD